MERERPEKEKRIAKREPKNEIAKAGKKKKREGYGNPRLDLIEKYTVASSALLT